MHTHPDHALRHSSYRWLISGTTINNLGNGISPVAIAFAVLDLGGSAGQLGLVVGAYALADVAAVVGGGVLGDRWSRTTMMRGSMAAVAAVQAVVAASLIGGWGSIWLLGVLGAINGALSSLAGPSTQAITPQTVPEGVLRKAGPLSDEEWTLMRQHPLTGAQILAPLEFFTDGMLIVRHHHERLDGSGYPDGLSGPTIPIGARAWTWTGRSTSRRSRSAPARTSSTVAPMIGIQPSPMVAIRVVIRSVSVPANHTGSRDWAGCGEQKVSVNDTL